MRTLMLLFYAAGIFFSIRSDAASIALETHQDQRNMRYGIGIEHNPATEAYSTNVESNVSNSASQESGGAALLKSAKPTQAAAKYVVHPHTLPPPVNNYTTLGKRLRFGPNTPPADGISDNALASKGQSLSESKNEEKTPHNPDDVWERLRLGLKIFWPSFVPVQPKIALKQETPVDASYSPDLHGINSESKQSLKAVSGESAEREQLAAVKYIIRPHTADAPLKRYTALGCRLRFGVGNSSGDNVDCNLPATAQNRQDSPDLADPKMPANQSNPFESRDIKKALIDERINRQIRFYSQNPRYLYRVAERARPYLYHIVEQLSQHHLPLELALLPIVESAYLPTAMSPKGAAGLWQFISGTGSDYDLDQNDQYDERLDVLASTQAAIRYLSDLNVHYKGDWLLALAAYNCGQGAVDSAINRNLSEGLPADYWSLRLPEETQNYVPRFLALTYIFANPENYGMKFAPIKNQPYSVKVTMDLETNERVLSN